MRAVDATPRAQAEFRFYEELNDFIAPALRKRSFAYAFDGTPSVKDAIEAIGVPHTEVDLVLVDGESVDFTRRLFGGERVSVYPVFERLDISPVTRLRMVSEPGELGIQYVMYSKPGRNIGILVTCAGPKTEEALLTEMCSSLKVTK